MQLGISELEFHGDLVYKLIKKKSFERIFHDQFKMIIEAL